MLHKEIKKHHWVWTLICTAFIVPSVGCSQSGESTVDLDTKKLYFKEISMGVVNFYDSNVKFPFAEPYAESVNAGLSWRVMVTPFCEGQPTFKAFNVDEPWDSETNKPLAKQMHPPFGFGNSGEKTSVCWIKASDKPMTKAAIRDGAANTIMLMENPNKVTWSKPGDLTIEEAISLVENLKDGESLVVAMYDCSVWTITNKIDIETFKAMLTPSGGEVFELSDIE